MRAAIAAVSIVAGCALAACSGSGAKSATSSATGSPSAPASTSGAVPSSASTSASATSTTNAKFCADAALAGKRIDALMAKANDPAALKKLLSADAAFLKRLKADAPASVQPELADLGGLLQQARTALANPLKPDLTKLQALATKLPAELARLRNYAASHCAPA
jgi:hypothetical protein